MSAFFEDMKRRGVKDPLLVTCDGAPGIIGHEGGEHPSAHTGSDSHCERVWRGQIVLRVGSASRRHQLLLQGNRDDAGEKCAENQLNGGGDGREREHQHA